MADNLIASGKWVYFADTVMGGVSEGQAQFQNTDQGPTMHLSGVVSTENNGGFIQVRAELPKGTVGTVKGIKIIFKGNGETYNLHLRNAATLLPWHYYAATFTAKGEWSELRIPFDTFERSARILPRVINPASLKSVGIVAYGKDYTADIMVSEVSFYD